MSRTVRFTYYVNDYTMDMSAIVEDSSDENHADAIRLIELLKKMGRARSQKTQDELSVQIFHLLQLSLDVQYAPGEIFEGEWITIPVNTETSSLAISLDGDGFGYQLSGDIWFDLTSNQDMTDEIMTAWEETTSGIELPAFSGGIGEYAVDSGSQLSWEILED